MTIFKDDGKVMDFTNWINLNNFETGVTSYRYMKFLYENKVLCSESMEEYFNADGVIETGSSEYIDGYLDYSVRRILLKKDDFIGILEGLRDKGKADLDLRCVYMDKQGTLLKYQNLWIKEADLKGRITLKGSQLDMSGVRYEDERVIRHFSEFI